MGVKLLAISGLGIAGAAGGGIYLYTSNNGEKINLVSDLLKQEKTRFALRKNSDAAYDGKWKAAWERYRKSHEVSSGNYKEKDTWGISNWNEKKGQGEVFEEFKSMCEVKYKLSLESKNSEEYRNVKNWCTGSKTIKELIEGEGERSILPDGEDSGWASAWNKFREHHKEAGGNTYKSSNEWGITGWTTSGNLNITSTNIKAKCKEQYSKDIDFEKELSDPLINQVVDWCTKSKNS